MSTDRQQLTKEITMEFIRRTPWNENVDTQEINKLVDNIIGEEKKGCDDLNAVKYLNRGQSVVFKIEEGSGELYSVQTGKTKVEVFFI